MHALLAAGFGQEWVELIIFGLAFIFWLLGKVFGVQQQPPARRPPGQALPRPPQAAPGDPLQSEIEEFLRRASGRKDGGAPAARNPNQPQPTKVRTAGVNPAARKPRPIQPASARTKAAAAPPALPDTPDGIDQHVKKYLSTTDFDRRVSQLSSIDRKEQEFDQQVNQTFAHEVGHLKGSAIAVAGEAPVTSAAAPEPQLANTQNSLAKLLSSPANLKSAVVLNEILQRPSHRW